MTILRLDGAWFSSISVCIPGRIVDKPADWAVTGQASRRPGLTVQPEEPSSMRSALPTARSNNRLIRCGPASGEVPATRRAEAPDALTREQVEHFLIELGQELLDRIERREFLLRFRNTLSAIAGLFRWRRRESHALLAMQDPVAAKLRDMLVRAKTMLEGAGAAIPQCDQKISQIDAIIEYLEGRGDPDILRFIEDTGEDLE